MKPEDMTPEMRQMAISLMKLSQDAPAGRQLNQSLLTFIQATFKELQGFLQESSHIVNLIDDIQFLQSSEIGKVPLWLLPEWDGKKVTVNICDWHRNETKKLKVE